MNKIKLMLAMMTATLWLPSASGQDNSHRFCWNAQTNPVQPIEGEIYLGFTSPVGKFYGSEATLGAALGLELRYNLREMPLDVGLHMGLTTSVHTFRIPLYYDEEIDAHDCDQSNRTLNLMVTSDWNFRQGRRVNPFIGLGLGFSYHDVLDATVYPDYKRSWSPGIMPRIGVELFRHLRLTLASNISRKGYNNVQLSVGVVIGGRPKSR